MFFKYPELEEVDAAELTKAARAHQNALAVVESDPALAWLFLVSAVEVAATQKRVRSDDPFDVVNLSYPKLIDLLLSQCGESTAREAASHLAKLVGSSSRFINFILGYDIPPPASRPRKSCFDWQRKNMKEALSKIYKYRSAALHGGTPFPKPMCRKPQWDYSGLDERPTGLAAGTNGGVWMAEDLPMLIWVFEYLVRQSLLAWWSELANASTPSQ